MTEPSRPIRRPGVATSIDKALELCEALSASERGSSLGELAQSTGLPPPTVHRLLGVLKRRGYVRQDEETQRYSLTLKMLDLSFRLLGRSELRLHAYPVLREYALRTGERSFIAVPANEEVTYIWSTGPDEVAMRTVYGRQMPGHCSMYFAAPQATRRLTCLKLVKPKDVASSDEIVLRLGPPAAAEALPQRLCCTCAPVRDYTGREVARVGLFGHDPDEGPTLTRHNRDAWELARQISLRLGHLPAGAMEVPA
ncbi:MAG: helix-turn-helix domain-containing protein [Acidobacteriota bacterium]|nr:helix-turn-helix domain-containing protein [Acidobacteriota bacterium]